MKYLKALIVALLVPTAAMAEGECQADRQKFCKDVAKGDVVACLDKHSAELSEACKAKREARAKECRRVSQNGQGRGNSHRARAWRHAGKRYK